MALLFARPPFAVIALLVLSCPVTGQEVPKLSTGENASELPDTSLSSDCRVPGSKLYTLAQLKAVRAALDEKRPLKVLALGPSGTGGVGSGSASATYPSRLEEELEQRFSGIDVAVEHRNLPGDITADAVDRFTALVAEIEPNLVVWQVGTNDALAKADIEAFTGALGEILEWLRQHDIDAVLVDPPYTLALASDEHYTALRAAIRNGARQNGVPIVLRFEALQHLSQQRSEAARSQLGLSELGYRCMAEHVALTINLSILQSAPLETSPAK
jgi:lysophospholipase L1-like esterase